LGRTASARRDEADGETARHSVPQRLESGRWRHAQLKAGFQVTSERRHPDPWRAVNA
jgi:hypothetical protein